MPTSVTVREASLIPELEHELGLGVSSCARASARFISY